MEEYTFRVLLPYQQDKEYIVEVDPTLPVMENFASIVEQTRDTEDAIPLAKTDESGQEIEIQWTFAWADSADEEGMEELAEHLSLEDQGVFAGSEIIVSDNTPVGAPPQNVDNSARLIHDRKALKAFVDRNSRHIRVSKWRPRSIDILVRGIRALIRLNGDGSPVYGSEHRIQILLPPTYPYEQPMLKPLTPIFHPNICLHGSEASVCYTVEYDPTGSDTFSFCVRQFVEIIQFRSYNLKEPHRNQNKRASQWLEGRLRQKNFDMPLTPMVRLR